MNWEYFNIAGYVSVLLWLSVPVLWILHMKIGPNRRLAQAVLVFAVAAFVLAKINSITHVNRIEVDRTAQMAEWQAQQEATRQGALKDLGKDAAQIAFAEDSAGDSMDKAGLDEADLKYMEKLQEDSVPDWKKAKKSRSGEGAPGDDLESMLGDGETTEGVESEELAEEIREPSAIMLEADMMLANRLDGLNLDAAFWAIFLGLLLVLVDYLRRANLYRHATAPLPLPSRWINALTPHPTVVDRPNPPRRKVPEELAWLTKRGDAFLYITDESSRAAEIPESMTRFANRFGRVEVLRVGRETAGMDDEFIFESLWFRRASFVVDSTARAEDLLQHFIEFLGKRHTTRARVRQTVHIVWDARQAMPESLRDELIRLGEPAGFSFFFITPQQSRT